MSAKTAAEPLRLPYRPCRPGCTEGEHCYERLPFVRPWQGQKNDPDTDYWDVPSVGGLAGGDITGRAMALAYMRHMEFQDPHEHDSFLGHIAQSMSEKLAALPRFQPQGNNDPRTLSLHAQMRGFMSVIELRLTVLGAKRKDIRQVTEAQIEDMAAKGLNHDPDAAEAYWTMLDTVEMLQATFKPEPIAGLW